MSGKQEKQNKDHAKFEYRMGYGPADFADATQFLNGFGENGWECFYISEPFRTSDGEIARNYAVRRKKTE